LSHASKCSTEFCVFWAHLAYISVLRFLADYALVSHFVGCNPCRVHCKLHSCNLDNEEIQPPADLLAPVNAGKLVKYVWPQSHTLTSMRERHMCDCFDLVGMPATAHPEVVAGNRLLLADVCQAAAVAVKARAAIDAMLGNTCDAADQAVLQADEACAAAADAIEAARHHREQLHRYASEAEKVELEREKLKETLATLLDTQTSAAKAPPSRMAASRQVRRVCIA